jgi:hypothetical protein
MDYFTNTTGLLPSFEKSGYCEHQLCFLLAEGKADDKTAWRKQLPHMLRWLLQRPQPATLLVRIVSAVHYSRSGLSFPDKRLGLSREQDQGSGGAREPGSRGAGELGSWGAGERGSWGAGERGSGGAGGAGELGSVGKSLLFLTATGF